MKKSCVAACPVEWPDGRGISGRMRVEWVAGSAWNRWSDAHGMGGQMTVESAIQGQRPQDRASFHVYGGKAALCFEADLTRNEVHTIALDAATATGPKQYNWGKKFAFN